MRSGGRLEHLRVSFVGKVRECELCQLTGQRIRKEFLLSVIWKSCYISSVIVTYPDSNALGWCSPNVIVGSINGTTSTGTLPPASQVRHCPLVVGVVRQDKAAEDGPSVTCPYTPMCLRPSYEWLPLSGQEREALSQWQSSARSMCES